MRMENKKPKLWLPTVLAGIMVLGMFAGYNLKDRTGGSDSFIQNKPGGSLEEVLSLVGNRYVDNVNVDSLDTAAIYSVLKHLDPHSIFIPAEEITAVNEDIQGNFRGIGVEFQIFRDTVHVLNVIADGPSFKAGLQTGDQIISVNDTLKFSGKAVNGDFVRKILKGPEGSKVKITVLRDKKSLSFIIERGIIPLPSVDAAYIIAPQKGYIRINKFSENTYREFMQSLEKLQAQKINSLILDLRDNPGGLLDQAVNIADEFLSGDKLIVYTKGAKISRTDFRSKRDGLFEAGKLIVLIDEGSASASEIVAGAVQDWDRGLIIGRRSFGKGLVQQQFRLSDGSALRLTVQRYYTPIGRNIQKSYSNGQEEYEEEIYQRYNAGEMLHGDTSTPQGPVYKTPGGRKVYGGGGITPDIFVPVDTADGGGGVLNKIFTRNTLNNFVYNRYMQDKKHFAAFSSPQDFEKKYQADGNTWKQFVAYAATDSVSIGTVPVKSQQFLLKHIKALLARQIWRTEGYYIVMNQDDPVIKAALAQ